MTDDDLRKLDQIVNDVHRHIEPIRKQSALFCCAVEAYANMLEKCRSEALERHEAEFERRRKERERRARRMLPGLLPGETFKRNSDGVIYLIPTPQQQERDQDPPQCDWLWTTDRDFCFSYLSIVEKVGYDCFWRPPEPVNPLARFRFGPLVKAFISPPDPPRSEEDVERLTREAFTLAIAHDFRLLSTESNHEAVFYGKPYSGQHFGRDGFARDVWNSIESRGRALDDLKLSWEWAVPRLEKSEQKSSGSRQGSQTGEAAAESPPLVANTTTEIPDEAILSPAKLAELFHVPYDALRKRLERLRRKNHNCFIEAENPKVNEAKYLYEVGKVRPIIQEMKASSCASSERPAEE